MALFACELHGVSGLDTSFPPSAASQQRQADQGVSSQTQSVLTTAI